MTFDPSKHIIQLKGKDYLETKWRIAWFRDVHPNGNVQTEIVSADPLIVRAIIYTDDGSQLATAHGSAQAKAGAVWSGREIEKAETAAIGRALGHAGFGTQFADDEGDHFADTPVSQRNTPPARPPSAQQQAPATNGKGVIGKPKATNGNPPAIEDAPEMQFICNCIEVKPRVGQAGKVIEFHSIDGIKATAWTRQVLVGVYAEDSDFYKSLAQNGTYIPLQTLKITYKRDARGFNVVEHVSLAAQADPLALM